MKRIILFVCGAVLACGQFQVGTVINGSALPKGNVFLTFDDGPDEPGPDGITEMQKVARFLHGPVKIREANPPRAAGVDAPVELSIRATFATVTCHYQRQDKANPGSAMCSGYGDVPVSVASEVIRLGHDLINHSQNHLPLTGITSPSEIIYEVGHAQQTLDILQGNSPRAFRAPGLAFNSAVAETLNADPYTGQLIGPIDTDVGGDFYLSNTGAYIGGDWDCIALGMSVPACGDLYVDAIQSATHGVVVLLHVRTEGLNGRNGNGYPLKLIHYIVKNLGPGYTYLPLDAIPGVLGSTTANPVQVSYEFSPSDGQGQVVAGRIAGKGQPAGLCKARSGAVFCKSADGHGGFLPSTQRLSISDPTWQNNYSSKFWLADINGDGRDDLIFPASGMLWLAYNNGQGGFYAPLAYFAGPLPELDYIHFGRVRVGGLNDMVVWTPSQDAPQIYENMGVRFGNPPPGGPAMPASHQVSRADQLRALQLVDINGDGLEDIVLPGGGQVWCVLSTGSGFGAPEPCSTMGGQFTAAQGWSDPAYLSTFAAVHIDGAAVAGGVPTGLIFAPIQASQSKVQVSDRYRYLCNTCFTNSADAAWRPDLRAAQVIWGDFTGSGNDSPCLIRQDGIYCGITSRRK